MNHHRAIELQDRALALAAAGRVLSVAPSAVGNGRDLERGMPAWGALRLQPAAVATRHWSTLAHPDETAARALDIAVAELRRRCAEVGWHDGPVWLAVPASLPPQALGRLLGAAARLPLQIAGFIEASVASAAALGLDRPALALELGLHQMTAVALECGGQIARRQVLSSERGGLLELQEGWLGLLRRLCVRRTRFDPLHLASSEQQLFESLPRVAREATLAGQAHVTVEGSGARFELTVTRDQLAEAGRWLYQELLQLLHRLRPAGAPVALLLPQALLEWPGLRRALDELHGCELVGLAPGFAAAAASALTLPARTAGHTVPLLRRYVAQPVPACAALATRELLAQDPAMPAITHLRCGERVVALGREPLPIGREGSEAPAIQLPEGMAGVSRRHCTLLQEGVTTVLIDHSRFGTFVNGERVRERVAVHAGDRIRIGEPGTELELLSLHPTSSSRDAPPSQS